MSKKFSNKLDVSSVKLLDNERLAEIARDELDALVADTGTLNKHLNGFGKALASSVNDTADKVSLLLTQIESTDERASKLEDRLWKLDSKNASRKPKGKRKAYYLLSKKR